ncbi:hypothetical protein AN641_03145 [Candidatus Epulonipiscioides gigas]|nr:hypothetical protein AN641_03145 [Epulopiscium sp. SCG-C07WGA-EpuloA2]
MYNVNNKKIINKLAIRTFKANKIRNIVAIIAIAMTTLLFTSTLAICAVAHYSIEQSALRITGSYAHGSIDHINYDDIELMKEHELIKECSVSRLLGLMSQDKFEKYVTGLWYVDANEAKFKFTDFIEGNLPKEDTNEIACDINVLKLLGYEPIIGNEITLTYELDNVQITDTFILSGYFEPVLLDEGTVYLSKTYVDKILEENPPFELSHIGRISMSILLNDSQNILEDIKIISKDANLPLIDETVRYTVNWAYLSEQSNISPMTMLLTFGLCLIFVLTGYLIIFNIFKISVSNDIKFYGLLKTIGATTKQIRKILYTQALILALIGIPIGLSGGYLAGILIAPIILNTLNIMSTELTINIWIFIGSSLFALVTVITSCRKPAKFASKVSPIEAVRYTGANTVTKAKRKTRKITVLNLALANISRSKTKTIVVIASLSLSLLILQFTFIATNGFDMNKFLKQYVITDFLIGNSQYFSFSTDFNENIALKDTDINAIKKISGIEQAGIVYGDIYSNNTTQTVNGEQLNIQLYAMDEYALDKLDVIEGTTKNGIILINSYNNFTEIGDIVTINYPIEVETLENEYGNYEIATSYKDISYTVVGIADIDYNLSYRYYVMNEESFILPSNLMPKDIENLAPMNLLLDVEESKISEIENFLTKYTTNENPMLNFESRQKHIEKFIDLKNMFVITGSSLGGIIGFIGILNFVNVILTSIITKKLEFATLQSIGMTGKQLKTMLVCEGLTYVIMTIIITLALTIIINPALKIVLSNIFWFFTAKFTVVPLIVITPILTFIGIITPIMLYKILNRQSIVERLRNI